MKYYFKLLSSNVEPKFIFMDFAKLNEWSVKAHTANQEMSSDIKPKNICGDEFRITYQLYQKLSFSIKTLFFRNMCIYRDLEPLNMKYKK